MLLAPFKLTFSKNSFRNSIRLLNSLDPDQARHVVRPDLGPICLKKLTAKKKKKPMQNYQACKELKSWNEPFHEKMEIWLWVLFISLSICDNIFSLLNCTILFITTGIQRLNACKIFLCIMTLMFTVMSWLPGTVSLTGDRAQGIFTSEGFVVSTFRQTLRLTTLKIIISAD